MTSQRAMEMMLKELALPSGVDELPDACRHALARLDGLTPGDFANVKKRFELLGHCANVEDWLTELQLEWRAKPDRTSALPVGFI